MGKLLLGCDNGKLVLGNGSNGSGICMNRNTRNFFRKHNWNTGLDSHVPLKNGINLNSPGLISQSTKKFPASKGCQ